MPNFRNAWLRGAWSYGEFFGKAEFAFPSFAECRSQHSPLLGSGKSTASPPLGGITTYNRKLVKIGRGDKRVTEGKGAEGKHSITAPYP